MKKTFWIQFFEDPATGTITGAVHGHNSTGDYRGNPYWIGCHVVEVDMDAIRKADFLAAE